jgi:hypothetical protein
MLRCTYRSSTRKTAPSLCSSPLCFCPSNPFLLFLSLLSFPSFLLYLPLILPSTMSIHHYFPSFCPSLLLYSFPSSQSFCHFPCPAASLLPYPFINPFFPILLLFLFPFSESILSYISILFLNVFSLHPFFRSFHSTVYGYSSYHSVSSPVLPQCTLSLRPLCHLFISSLHPTVLPFYPSLFPLYPSTPLSIILSSLSISIPLYKCTSFCLTFLSCIYYLSLPLSSCFPFLFIPPYSISH